MSDRRLERLVVLVTPAEKTSIREAAGNVPLSAYMRGKLLGTPVGTPETSPEKSDRKAVRVRQLQAQGHTARSARQIAEQEEA